MGWSETTVAASSNRTGWCKNNPGMEFDSVSCERLIVTALLREDCEQLAGRAVSNPHAYQSHIAVCDLPALTGG